MYIHESMTHLTHHPGLFQKIVFPNRASYVFTRSASLFHDADRRQHHSIAGNGRAIIVIELVRTAPEASGAFQPDLLNDFA